MAKIHVLDSETIDKIAAGEVVERPSSVVKELVENAVDAGARAVTVEVKEGGIEFIRVTDDGAGMAPDQVRTAFLRHATSKIGRVEDLTRISSLGFRGEALSSIAAVSRVEVITRTPEALTGVRYLTEGAVEKAFEEIGAPAGTTFLVRNLFYNTPVRRKFLKQPATEGGYVADLMEHLALSRPDVSFKFILGGQVKFHTSGNGSMKEVIYRIYGRDMAARLIPIHTEREGVSIEGYLGKAEVLRSNRNFEIYYINGRFIRSQVVSRAIEEGYREYMMQHKFPFCVLHLGMDTKNVDVNVHPTKMDVRFSDAPRFLSLLSGAVRETLRGTEMIPETGPGPEKKEKLKSERQNTPEPFETVRAGQYRVMEESLYRAERLPPQDILQNPAGTAVAKSRTVSKNDEHEGSQSKEVFFTDEPPEGSARAAAGEGNAVSEAGFAPEDLAEYIPGPQTAAGAPADAELSGGAPGTEKALGTPPAGKPLAGAPWSGKPPAGGSRAGTAASEMPLTGEAASETPGTGEDASRPEGKPVQLELFGEKMLSAENRSRYQIVGQVFDTYWLVQFEDKLLIIDQHAAHEKVKYERLIGQYRSREALSQSLMPPVIVSLTGQEETALRENLETFLLLGFEVEAFGGSEYALRSVPVDLYGCGEREMFLEVLDELTEGPLRGNLKAVEEKIASMSCKAAVKGNHHMSREEAQRLIDELLTLENPYNCPHGRPTIISMSKTEMEKKFKRIV